MDIRECHRVLELDIGAPRDAVEAAYLRLLERWHPDRVTPVNDAAAIAEATRMVQVVNESYQTLIKIAPDFQIEPADPVPVRKKPALPPLSAAFLPENKPPPPPPFFQPPSSPENPPGIKAHESADPTQSGGVTLKLQQSPTPDIDPATHRHAPAIDPVATVAGKNAPPFPAPVQTSGAPAPAPTLDAPPPIAAVAPPTTNPPAAFDLQAKVVALHDALFPVGTPRRRYSLLILTAALLLLLLLGKCAFPSRDHKGVSGPDPTKTGVVTIKSNRPDTEVELTRNPIGTEREAASAPFHDSGAESTLRGLPPGKYVLTAKSKGWPDIRRAVSVEIAHTTEIAIHFKSGSLRVESDPAGATVRSANAVLGKTPLIIPQLPPGECLLSLESPGWPVVAVKTTIIKDREVTEKVRLPHGKLTVESIPSGATVLFAGRAVGQTPLTLTGVPAGISKLTLQGKNFPPMELSVAVADRGESKISRELGSGFPELDAPALLRAVWLPDDPNQLAPRVDSLGHYEPRNGIVRNLHRKLLFENWLNRSYRYSATIKSYDRESGKIEFAEQANALSRYRVLAELSPAARSDKDLAAQLTKGATLTLYGRLAAVEEPRWPFKIITLEISLAEPLH